MILPIPCSLGDFWCWANNAMYLPFKCKYISIVGNWNLPAHALSFWRKLQQCPAQDGPMQLVPTSLLYTHLASLLVVGEFLLLPAHTSVPIKVTTSRERQTAGKLVVTWLKKKYLGSKAGHRWPGSGLIGKNWTDSSIPTSAMEVETLLSVLLYSDCVTPSVLECTYQCCS